MALRNSTGLLNKLMGVKTNLFTNPTFDSDTTGWTATDATIASVASGQSGNALEITESGGSSPGKAYQDVATLIGVPYQISFYFKAGTSATGSVTAGTTGDDDADLVSRPYNDATWTKKRISFIASATTTRIAFLSDDATVGETSLFDEVVCEELMDGFGSIMNLCKVNVYTGSQPALADDAASGTLLYTLTKDGDGVTGLTWDDAVAGVASKKTGEIWQGTAVASGVAGWFRCFAQDNNPALADTTTARFDAAIATSGAVGTMANTTITAGAVQTGAGVTYSLV